MRTEKEKMLAGELYNAGSPELQADAAEITRWMARYNQSQPEERPMLLTQTFASLGENVNIRPPFYCDYGYNITLGNGVFMNFNCIILGCKPRAHRRLYADWSGRTNINRRSSARSGTA
ncbi:maltose acetyltransferase domain-containing protein [Chitinophaga sedimenti]|uniref:maltose acetyltransferase domain-containing protein n=1 Tax=Chitinophaga sedimenti TaxID=2033606 RepID=UPI0027E06E5E|nr:maltose acetyltransferase domain-containing protein [Chitinophaga sedimenti]